MTKKRMLAVLMLGVLATGFDEPYSATSKPPVSVDKIEI